MSPNYLHRICICLFALVNSAGALAAGPTGKYYLTAGTQHQNWIVQGTATTSFAQVSNGGANFESPIAVAGDIRTISNTSGGGTTLGSQYTPSGVFTGTTYAGVAQNFYDGATDGARNFSVNYPAVGTGTVFAMTRNWTTPTPLFVATGNVGPLGITYDPLNSSLWVSDFGGTRVQNYSLSGALLGGFNTAFSSITALAMDYSDGTLWMGSQSTQGTFYQYSRAGLLLQTVQYASLVSQNTLGGEFNFAPVPEPATFMLLGGGIALLAAAARGRTWWASQPPTPAH